MPISYKVLGQSISTANTLVQLYQTPVATNTVISTIAVCNQANTPASFSLAVKPTGGTVGTQNYINYNTPLPGNDTIALTLGIKIGRAHV